MSVETLANTVACRPVAAKQTTKQHPLLGNTFLISRYTQPLLSNAFANRHVPTEKIGVQEWTVFSTLSVTSVITEAGLAEGVVSRVEAGSNTPTITLRVVGGDEKGSLESETVKYGRESHGTRIRKWLRWRGPAVIINDRPVLSLERAPTTNPQLPDSNKNLVVSPRWVLYSKSHWPTDRRS
jgi:hypothetical protein